MSRTPDPDVDDMDVEKGTERSPLLPAGDDSADARTQTTLLDESSSSTSLKSNPRFRLFHLVLAFVAGLLTCVVCVWLLPSLTSICCSPLSSALRSSAPDAPVHAAAPPHVGSTTRHHFPPASPVNDLPSLFPTNVGYAGATPTGAEPAVVLTAPAYPVHSGAPQLVVPGIKNKGSKGSFDLFKHWGNLSPWYSVNRGAFGVDSSPEAPQHCSITGLHFLHRHGARYPTAYAQYGGPARLASKLHKAASKWNGSGDLQFLNNWTYKLGEELLTPFGRQQLYDLGVSLRLKYGYLLENFTKSDALPVFRTESQDRMLHSALNFAVGFFGLPIEGKYLQSVTIEADGFNNTLAPYKTCPNANHKSKAYRATPYVREWTEIYLKKAQKRLRTQIKGHDLSIEDVYTFQQLCAYETVAIGYSAFCTLFTEEEWEGFDYSLDLQFWYNSAFGSPVGRVQGIGYIQELIARLTHTPIEMHNSSTNSTLDDDPITFPLNQGLYVDATHEVVILNIITALNLTSFAAGGPLPSDHIPEKRPFMVSQLAPFAANVQFQLLDCVSTPEPQIRIIINDGVVPLTGIHGCPRPNASSIDGMCPLSTFVTAQRETIRATDWMWECHGKWEVPPGKEWNTTIGAPPLPPSSTHERKREIAKRDPANNARNANGERKASRNDDDADNSSIRNNPDW